MILFYEYVILHSPTVTSRDIKFTADQVIYCLSYCTDRLKYTDVKVGNTSDATIGVFNLCGNTGSGPWVNDLANVTMVCEPPSVGRYVMLKRNGGKETHILNFCEVYVIGYKVGGKYLFSYSSSITVLLTCSHQCQRLVKKRPSMCYYICVIMHVKDP